MSIRLLWMAIMNAARVVREWLELDYMEYSSDANAQAAYVSNALLGDELIVNGTMELDSNWSNWNNPSTNERSTTQKHAGTYSRKYICDSINDGIQSDTFSIINGATYTVSAWVYSSNTSIYMWVYTSAGGTQGGRDAYTVTANTWTNLTYNFTSNASVSDTTVAIFSPDGTTCYVDDVSVKRTNLLQSYSESTIKTQGDHSLKIEAVATDSLNKTLTKTFDPPKDLSGKTQIKYDVRASRTGSNFKIGFHDSGGTTTKHTPNILVAKKWQTETVDISAVSDADKDAIDSKILTILNADSANTIYIDNVRYG